MLLSIDISKPFSIALFDENKVLPDVLLCWQFVDLRAAIAADAQQLSTSGSVANDIQVTDLGMIVDGKWKKQSCKPKFNFSFTYNHRAGNFDSKTKSNSNSDADNNTNSNADDQKDGNNSNSDRVRGGILKVYVQKSAQSSKGRPFRVFFFFLFFEFLFFFFVCDKFFVCAPVIGAGDPYVVFDNGSGQTVKTQVIKNNGSPHWNEDLELAVPDDKQFVRITIMDEDLHSDDDLLCMQYLYVDKQCAPSQTTQFEPMEMVLCPAFYKKATQPTLTFSVVYEPQ